MYDYTKMKPEVLTDEGQRQFLKIRDRSKELLKTAGGFRMGEIMAAAGGGDSWTIMACVDRLVELGEIREVKLQEKPAGQHRIFVAA